MADEITDRLDKFILTEEEKDSIEIDLQDIMSSMENCEVSLLGKVIADKQVSVLGLKNTNDAGLGKSCWSESLTGREESFSVCFSIQRRHEKVWNISLHWISYEVGSKIGHALGGTSDVAIPENGSKDGRHICLKWKINKDGVEEKWVEFRFENLPYVCYYYGILGHIEKSCILCEEYVQNGNVKRDQFGIWMRAESHRFVGNNPKTTR
ncbi:hypothetical protein R3W88_019248 [Solanum pinnatisectum]|uniref:Zinc knuckle CX2CX4HX4C domain-containing protein n=1 Tax=Solanum pinnatisectum TaxID=50273 RepID=A0AAV9KJ65_9SOLN|nr:hypothetical protein R3W88_019248 [Solanum pinnatisectum]